MGIDLHVTATRKIKYEDPKTKEWLDDTESYDIDTLDFGSRYNQEIACSPNPLVVYHALVNEIWGNNDLANRLINNINEQIEEAENKGYTVEWEAW